MAEQDALGVALVGCGTVGSSVARLLLKDADLLRRRGGQRLELRHVVDKDFARARQTGVSNNLLRDDLKTALADKRTSIVVELVGGTGFARTVIEQALRAGKHVVTANKALMAHHGAELFALARANGVCISLEGSCVGGVPIIGALTNGLLANDIVAFYGIVNGTCNYILTEMAQRGSSYADVLAAAQRAGLAEADPSLDVQGTDSAHKLTILAALAFGLRTDLSQVYVEGIDKLNLIDVGYGRTLDYCLKLLAIAERQEGGVSLRVHPAFVHIDHPLARVAGPFNAVSVYGHANGHTMYYGRGAGGSPTASAVLADVMDVALGNAPRRFAQLGIWPDVAPPAVHVPIEHVRGRYYLRVTCADQPGVLAQIAAVLGRYEISIASVLQKEPLRAFAGGVPVVITTYSAVEGNVRKALAEMDALEVVKAPTVIVRILEEYPEPEV